MTSEFDTRGFVFWAVGNGDSTTVVIKENEVVMQVDLRHMGLADDEDDPHVSIVDELEEKLPKQNGRPYLSVFALTHLDEDHIQGFKDLLERIDIGEIWHTPRIFREQEEELREHAAAFKEEVERRRDVVIQKGGEPDSGDRLRIIGHDQLLEEEEYEGFPDECRTVPGNPITRIDGADYESEFEAFIHAPFKDDSEGERNDTSLAMQIQLQDGDNTVKALLFGDLKYPIIKKIFQKTEENENLEKVEWNILLAPHHCSKSVMYWPNEGEDDESLQNDILDYLEKFAIDEKAYIVASCESDFSNKKGKNPPHKKARDRYEELIDSGNFLCTHEHLTEEKPEPIQFELGDQGFNYIDSSQTLVSTQNSDSDDFLDAVATARGNEEPPTKTVGFG
ncbi:MAG: hypothetical protein AAF572_21465 [Cyanobacteria bacterium P01_B01_bin.77]